MTNVSIEGLQKTLQKELDEFRSCQKEYQNLITKRQQIDAQLNENTGVKNELDRVRGDGEVFKLIGPVLIKQDTEEAIQNVVKRMEYMTNELKRLDDLIIEVDKKQEKHRNTLTELQKTIQEAAAEIAAAAGQ